MRLWSEIGKRAQEKEDKMTIHQWADDLKTVSIEEFMASIKDAKAKPEATIFRFGRNGIIEIAGRPTVPFVYRAE